MADTAKVEEQPAHGGVYPLGPARSDAERLLWLEFEAVQARQDINTLTQTLTALTVNVNKLNGRLMMVAGMIIAVMTMFKMLPDKSLDLLRHFLAG